MMPAFRNFVRATCRVRLVSGEVTGAYLASVRFAPPDESREAVVRWVAGEALHAFALLLPAASVWQVRRESAATLAMRRPAVVEPVKAILSTPRLRTR